MNSEPNLLFQEHAHIIRRYVFHGSWRFGVDVFSAGRGHRTVSIEVSAAHRTLRNEHPNVSPTADFFHKSECRRYDVLSGWIPLRLCNVRFGDAEAESGLKVDTESGFCASPRPIFGNFPLNWMNGQSCRRRRLEINFCTREGVAAMVFIKRHKCSKRC